MTVTHQTEIFGPLLAMMGLTLAVWLFMFARRIPFIRSLGDVDLSVPGELARLSPASVSNPSDNLKNLFELPVLFYAICLYLYAAGKVDGANPETLAIRDKSNLVLGTLLFEANQFGPAQATLDRVRLEGPFSNQALLRAGWSDVSAENSSDGP